MASSLSASCPQKSCRRLGTKAPLSYSRRKARDRTLGQGRSVGALGCAVCPPSPSTRRSSCSRLRPDCGPNSPAPVAPRCRNTWRRSCNNWMGTVTNTQGRGVNMEQAQQNRRAVLIVEDDAEMHRLEEMLLEDGDLSTIEWVSTDSGHST